MTITIPLDAVPVTCWWALFGLVVVVWYGFALGWAKRNVLTWGCNDIVDRFMTCLFRLIFVVASPVLAPIAAVLWLLGWLFLTKEERE